MKALFATIGFIVGIALFSIGPASWWVVAFVGLLAFALLSAYKVRPAKAILLAALCFAGASLGAARANLAHGSLPDAFISGIGSTVTLTGKIIAEPDVRETSVRLTLRAEESGSFTKILIVAPPFPEVRYGEVIEAQGKLVLPEPFDTDTGRVFRYDRFLAKDGIYAVMERASVKVVGSRTGPIDHVFGFFTDMKHAGIDAVSVALPEPEASLASGLILGGKQGLGNDLLDDFIVAGLVHVVVLSGYNVMIVAEAVFRTFALLAKRYAALAAGVVIAGFVLVAGAGAASIRAGIMAGVALFGRASGRTYDAFRALMAAGILMLLWNPLLLAYDPGFQLSFIATLGLIFGAPITERWVSFVRLKFLREILSATIAAQVSVLPLLLYQNGTLSLVALPANALVLPVIPLAMAVSALAGLAGFLLPGVAPLIALPAYAILSYVIGATEFFANLPLASVSVPTFPFLLTLVVYAMLAWSVGKRIRNPGGTTPSRAKI